MADQTGKPGPDADSDSDQPDETPKQPARASRRPTKAAGAASRARRIGGGGRSSPTGHGSRRSIPAAEPDLAATSSQPDALAEADLEHETAAVAADTDTGAPDADAADADADAADTDSDDDADEPGADSDDSGADSDSDADDDSTSSAEVGVAQVPSALRWVPAGVLGTAAVVMIVLVLIAAHSVWYAKPSTSATRDQVLAAAKTCTARSNTYNYTSLDKDEAAAAKCTTGTYTAKFTKAFDRLVKPKAVQLKASQSVQVNAAGIETVGHSRWTVVVYGQTRITQAGAQPRTDPFAAEVVMQRVGGHWLIKDIKLPSAAN